MSVTVANLKAAVLLAVRSGPYTADGTFETRVENVITYVVSDLNKVLAWWYQYHGLSITAATLPDELGAIGYVKALATVLLDIGRTDRGLAQMQTATLMIQQLRGSYPGGQAG